jgi:hypothetical protein
MIPIRDPICIRAINITNFERGIDHPILNLNNNARGIYG